ncbi:MAG: hypothetical protein HY314_02290 [Acidobacteria bacterium]|nr:hypothetical protein [Acidobacteriota bacterium]
MIKLKVLTALCLITLLSSVAASVMAEEPSHNPRIGVLLLAHGGKTRWNDQVVVLATRVNLHYPTEAAFGMASKPAIEAAIKRLVERGAKEIVAVPLFVSSHSAIIESVRYLLGLRRDMPPEYEHYARMSHGHGSGEHDGYHTLQMSADLMAPIHLPVPVKMTSALDDHPLVADILLDRALAISTEPSHEVVIVVAHGPVKDGENERWLADMRRLAERMRPKSHFKEIEIFSVRDDAPEPQRTQVAKELRALVSKTTGAGKRVLIVPLLISYGGIEEGIKKRLEGLPYKISDCGLLPDERLVQWVAAQVEASRQK